jgi:hypothetical protein
MEGNMDAEVWATQGKIGRAINATPIKIHLKNPTAFPHQRHYPLGLSIYYTVSMNGKYFQ